MNEYWNFVDCNIVERSTEEIVELIKKINIGESVYLTVPQLKKLEDILNIIDREKLRHCSIFLYLNCPTELTYTEYKYFHSKYNLYHIFVKGFSKAQGIYDKSYNKADNVDPNIMLIYLKKLNELTRGLPKYSTTSFEDNVKTICVLYNRIIQKVFFDVNPAIFETLNRCKHKYYVPNEIKGLIDEKAVCRGYAGIFRDTCTILGFNVINIHGFDESKTMGHEWNQIKILENWYDCDLMWDRYCIINKLVPVFLLSSDIECYNHYMSTDGFSISHSTYLNNCNTSRNKANSSVSRKMISSFLYIEEEKKNNWLKLFLQKKLGVIQEDTIKKGMLSR